MMKRLILAIAIIAGIAGTARADFILNGTPLTTNKSDLFPTPIGANPLNYITASDYNAVAQASLDIRSAITGVTSGYALRLNDASSAAVSASGTGAIRYNNTSHIFEQSLNGGAWGAFGGGGGTIGGSIAANQVAYGSGANTIQGTSNFTYNGSSLSMTPTATSSGAVVPYFFGVPANTGETASTEVSGFWISPANRQWNTGALATQREVLITAPTISFVGASTVTQAATLAITSPPLAGTNATITNAYALWLQAGNLAMAPGTSILSASQGATNTTGLTILTNVASGASSTGLVIDNTTSFPAAGGTYLDLRNAGTSIFRIFNDSFGAPRFLNTTGTGFSLSGASGYLMGSSTYAVLWNSTVLQSYTDKSTALGTISTRWNGVFNGASTSCGRNAQSGTTYTTVAADCKVVMTNSAARTVTLATAATYPAGGTIEVWDGNNNASTANVSVARSGSDTINGGTANIAVVTANSGHSTCTSDGTSVWICGINN